MKKSLAAAAGAGIIIIAILVSTLAPQSPPEELQDEKIGIVASFFPLYDFAKNIGGDKVGVSVFVPIGVEPHDWEPSSKDLKLLKNADVFVYNGNMEIFTEKLINSGEFENVDFVETTKGLDLVKNTNDENRFAYDPHVWLDPVLAQKQVDIIKDAMVRVDKNNSEYFEKNAEAYKGKLAKLDDDIRNGLSHCNKDTFVSFHNAFSYFAKRYNIKSVPLTGISPEAEPTPAELKDFIDYVRNNNIKVIFAEDLIDPRLAQVLADEAGAQVMVLSPIEGLSDEDVAQGKDYIGKMQDNLDALKIALECS